MQTWSALPVLFNSGSVSYDFTTAKSKAYGNNEVDLLDGKFAVYNGDLEQNGTIDSIDLSNMQEYITDFSTGYLVGDITGDNIIETADYSLIENNVKAGIVVLHP